MNDFHEESAGAFQVSFVYTGLLTHHDLAGRLISESPRAPGDIQLAREGRCVVEYERDADTSLSDRDAIVAWLMTFPGIADVRVDVE